MSTGTLERTGRYSETLLSDETYHGSTLDHRAFQSPSAPPITMEASSRLTIPFGNNGWLVFERKPGDWFMPLLSQICDLMLLPPNWDTYGAKPIDPYIALSAIGLLFDLLSEDYPSPSIVPTNRGGIQLEWHDRGIDLEIDFQSPSSACLSFEDGECEEEYEHVEHDIIQEKLKILRGRLHGANGNA